MAHNPMGIHGLLYQPPNIIQGNKHCLLPAFALISILAYSSTLKMEATCSSEMSVDFQLTTRYIPEDRAVLIRCIF
jgi:hypothetical protein